MAGDHATLNPTENYLLTQRSYDVSTNKIPEMRINGTRNLISTRDDWETTKNGAVYTPIILSQYVAQKLVQYAIQDKSFEKSKKLNIVDPAVGNGILLESIAKTILIEKKLTHKKINVCGTDINLNAINSSRSRLSHLSEKGISINLIKTNALSPFSRNSFMDGWSQIFNKINIEKGFDLLIANPPWGADISEYRKLLHPSDFETMRGQFDSFELFVELAIKLVRSGGYFALIVPDAILNHGKSILRGLLLTRTQIKFIARLGEKIFPNINRGCVVIICRNTHPTNTDIVDCFRLPSKDRARILNGFTTFGEVERRYRHYVHQERFKENLDERFNIDLKEKETELLKKFKKFSQTLGTALLSARGVELGSEGVICRCKKCLMWMPFSEKNFVICQHCGQRFSPKQAKIKSIISSKKNTKSVPLLVGSDIKRYRCSPSRWIRIIESGINYKSKDTYHGPKILIRKTGVGITAALDYTNSYVNQVVYILKKSNKNTPSMEFFIALINSRAYYFYLVKSFGELEWKSHPYLTQTEILSLPLPDISSPQNRKIIQRITKLLRPILKKGFLPDKKTDIQLELMVGKLFALNRDDYKIIFGAINESDDLLPVRELKKIELKDLLKKTA